MRFWARRDDSRGERRSGRSLAVLVMGSVLVLGAAGQDVRGAPADATRGPSGDATYVGMDTCKSCHKTKLPQFLQSVHGKAEDPRTPAAKHQCETCHGPGSLHASHPTTDNIIRFTKRSALTATEKNAVCLACHSTMRTHIYWQGSIHQMRGLACVNCHQLHGTNARLLVKPDQSDVCFQCHLKQKSEVQMAFHHPIREGEMKCTDCHNPHGTAGEKLLTANTVNEKCYQCHADKRGPFVWNHSPAVENCLNCHTPHGGRHDFLLVARAPWLCQRCHSGEGHQGIMYAPNIFGAHTANSNTANVYNLRPQNYGRSCWQCHVAIHGSRSPSGNTFLR